ncbi:MAG: ABC transporter ATP-binding protein [Candidatus Lokiarchaeota archaeon]|nr:ABC transporter ATP-binding protein [Candidatus Lokiarchaeota archaeon]
MNAIEVRNLRKYYDKGKVKAVDGISFDVPKGSRFGFLGPNGAGKTTTIRCLLGFLNTDAGDISILGERINPKKDVKIRNRIGYLPGELGIYKNMTANGLINYFAKLYDIEIDWKFVNEISERLKLDMNRKMGVLSKGNKQKVGVLSALMGKFDILIMDEPTSGLDPLNQTEFYRIVSERQKESKCTVFICSHVLSEVEKFCDRVAIIKKGKIAEIANVQDLKAKNLKHIELIFESANSMESFHYFLSSEFPEAIVKYNFDVQLEFLLPPEDARKILHEISEREWAGTPVKDFSIRHSTLENIFMQYYKDVNSQGGEIT